jgi:hypothetical protein
LPYFASRPEPEQLRRGKAEHKRQLEPERDNPDSKVEHTLQDPLTGKRVRPDHYGTTDGSPMPQQGGTVQLRELKPMGYDLQKAIQQMLKYVDALERRGYKFDGMQIDTYLKGIHRLSNHY